MHYKFLIAQDLGSDGKVMLRVEEDRWQRYEKEAKYFFDRNDVKVFTSLPSTLSFDGYGTVSNLKWSVIEG